MTKLYQLLVSADPKQEMSFQIAGLHVHLAVYYNTLSQNWQFDVSDADTGEIWRTGQGMSCGAPMLSRTTLPFRLWLHDTSGLQLNPTSNDLGSRVLLYVEDVS